MAKLTGRAAFLRLLADEGVDTLFGNPGTTELAIMEALGAQSEIGFVLGLQEGIVVSMADGYARASGRLAACNVHVAPGLGNAMGSLFNAKWYGSPVILTAGQQEQGHGLMEPLLYDPLVPIAQPLVKWAVEVNRFEDLPRILRRAAKIALTPPTGPVFISLPGDILDAEGDIDLGHRTRVDTDTRPNDAVLERLAQRLLTAVNPVIVAGHELQSRDAWAEATRFAELLGAPVYQQTVPYAAHYPSEHVAYMGGLTRNQRQVRDVLAPHDLLVSLGGDSLRMSVYSPVDPLPAGMPIVHIAERSWDLGKNYPTEFAVAANVKETLAALLPVMERLRTQERAATATARLADLATKNWTQTREKMRAEARKAEAARPLDPRVLMMHLCQALPPDAVVVEEGLTATDPLRQHYAYRDPHSLFGLASGGIGFAMGGAVGIAIALAPRPVCAIIGDGSAMYSIQALWSAAHMKLPITYVIANNRSYRILKERLVSYRRTEKFIGMDFRDPPIDFVAMANSMGVEAVRVTHTDEIVPAIRESMASGRTRLVEVMVSDGFGG
jgi:benzoylformate decarboxylase